MTVATDPLAQLKDIHLPPPISVWPLATGWWILFIIISLIAIFTLHWWYQDWKRNKARKYALVRLDKLSKLIRNDNQQDIIRELSTLVRRVMLAYFPRRNIASLQGDAWLEFLDHVGSTHQFSKGAGRILVTAPYRKESKMQLQSLIKIIRNWLNSINLP